MGIPSYFRHLTRSLDGLLVRNVPKEVSWLCLDFNCMIYHVLQRPDCVIGGGEAWEAEFMNEIVRYVMKVVRHVGPKVGVFLGVDGVVPMAKIKQQRMRRFRGGEGVTEVTDTPKFNKNAITPGTDFMKRLGERLTRMAGEHRDIRWKLSLADEPGEGEHKLMAFIRAMSEPKNIVIYGLDADLIVLSLLVSMEKSIENVWLFREVMESSGGGGIKRDALGEEEFHFFAISALIRYIRERGGSGSGIGKGYLIDYCNAMMLLGNDFLPTSMTFRIREDGHEELCKMIREIRELDDEVNADEETPVTNLMIGIFERLAKEEEGRFYRTCTRKLNSAVPPREEDGPIQWKGEAIFFHPHPTKRILNRDWRDIYYRTCLGGVEKSRVVQEYWRGMRWVLDYYKGRAVNMSWMYSWHYPPLWEDVLSGFWDDGAAAAVAAAEESITPTEQLALVLPVRDWNLLPKCAKERKLPLIAPEWFPEKFGLTHIGRMWLWECEPEIPIPIPREMRERLSGSKYN